MKAQVAQIEVDVTLDLDTAEPDISVRVNIEQGFEFLQNQRGAMAAWLRAAANSLDPDVDTPMTKET